MQQPRIIFLVLPHVHLLDLAGPMQVFQEAQGYGLQLTMTYCSFSEGSEQASSGFPLAKLVNFSSIYPQRADIILIPGTDIKYLLSLKRTDLSEIKLWLGEAYQTGATIGSICTGAFFLAAIGLLDGRKCTTHWKRANELKQRYPKVNLLEDVLFTEDENIFTSAGVTAGIDMAIHMVSRLADNNIAFKVARELVVYLRRNGGDSQQSIFTKYRNHINSGVHRVQDYVQEYLEKGANLPLLSDIACMSTRNLTRSFRRETGITINEYLNLVRKEKLKELVHRTNYTRKQMARLCGLTSERQVIRLIKQIS